MLDDHAGDGGAGFEQNKRRVPYAAASNAFSLADPACLPRGLVAGNTVILPHGHAISIERANFPADLIEAPPTERTTPAFPLSLEDALDNIFASDSAVLKSEQMASLASLGRQGGLTADPKPVPVPRRRAPLRRNQSGPLVAELSEAELRLRLVEQRSRATQTDESLAGLWQGAGISDVEIEPGTQATNIMDEGHRQRRRQSMAARRHSVETGPELMLTGDERWQQGTYINCDLRFFELRALGKFDVVYLDPPWRIRGSQTCTPDGLIFSNSARSLHYDTMSTMEILDLDIPSIVDSGFIFMWTLTATLPAAMRCLDAWGFHLVDKITWVRLTPRDNIAMGIGYYFLHSTELCLVGMRSQPGARVEFIHKVSNDLLFAQVREPSEKPLEMYEIIERMMPGARKIELFARNNNLRRGWLSVGNHLGFNYDYVKDHVACDACSQSIAVGRPRFKSELVPNRDLCEPCLERAAEPRDAFMRLDNTVDRMVFHANYICDRCAMNPICGIRFSCCVCDFDLCEGCYDWTMARWAEARQAGSGLAALAQLGRDTVWPAAAACCEEPHEPTHAFVPYEESDVAGGLPKHHARCAACLDFPIIGYRFFCTQCPAVSLCQKCFFRSKAPRDHASDHAMALLDRPAAPCACEWCVTDVHRSLRAKLRWRLSARASADQRAAHATRLRLACAARPVFASAAFVCEPLACAVIGAGLGLATAAIGGRARAAAAMLAQV